MEKNMFPWWIKWEHAKARKKGRTDEDISIEVYQQRKKDLASMGFSSYAEYLESPLWQLIKEALLPGECEGCGKDAFTLHHFSYAKDVLLGKNLTKLMRVCRRCHYRIEFDNGIKNQFIAAQRKARKMYGLRKKAIHIKRRAKED